MCTAKTLDVLIILCAATGGVIQWLVAAKAHGSIFQTVGGWITAWFVLTFWYVAALGENVKVVIDGL